MNQITNQLNTLMAEKLGVSKEMLTPDARFREDLGVDSLDLYELFISTEKLFDLTIPDEEAEKMTTVGDLINFVTQQKYEQTG